MKKLIFLLTLAPLVQAHTCAEIKTRWESLQTEAKNGHLSIALQTLELAKLMDTVQQHARDCKDEDCKKQCNAIASESITQIQLLGYTDLAQRLQLLEYYTLSTMHRQLGAYAVPAPVPTPADPSMAQFIPTGATTYALGRVAEHMLLTPVRSRLVETAAIGTGLKYAAAVAKPIAIVTVVTWLAWTVYRFFNKDSSAEALRNELLLKINSLEKSMRKADAQVFERTKNMIHTLQQEQRAALADIKANESENKKLFERLQGNMQHMSELIGAYDKFITEADTLSPDDRRSRHAALKKKVVAHQKSLEEALNPTKKRGLFARLKACVP